MPSTSALRRAAVLVFSACLLTGGLAQAGTKHDRRIEAAAAGSYNFKTYLKDDKIAVCARDGVVTLTGTVAAEHHKWLAQETVAGLPGAKSVENKLEVDRDQPTAASDDYFSVKVRASLAFHNNVSAANTQVRTAKGVVTLTGQADSEAQRQLTTEYAKDVEGVVDVINAMTVAAQPRKETLGEKIDDASITAQVKTTLLFHKSTHAAATTVSTKLGVVTLAGKAKNAAERDLVAKLARTSAASGR
jgi:osmotically-inducible protein OsmY